MTKTITIDPAQPCMYLNECGQPATTALIWPFEGYGLKPPRRYVMMPVCKHHLSAAMTMYPPDGPGSDSEATPPAPSAKGVTPAKDFQLTITPLDFFVTKLNAA